MTETTAEKKHITIGILAHVDAGKTTLSEELLYETGVRKQAGRVDNGDTLLDHDEMERNRGITIFSKQAELSTAETDITLLDTPGHVDFTAEMERTLQVLDYAILVISASDRIQAHTKTVWRLLNEYRIPVFLFVNKMDQPNNLQSEILTELQDFSDKIVAFSCYEQGTIHTSEDFYESIAMASEDETILNTYMEQGELSDTCIQTMIKQRHIIPCYFGSALKGIGVDALLNGLDAYTTDAYQTLTEAPFGARVYKITRDEKGNRLAHIKVMQGTLSVRDTIGEEKVTQIRIYNGEHYQTVPTVTAGHICSITGLETAQAGDGIGDYSDNPMACIEPVISYTITFDEAVSTRLMYTKIKDLDEELPELHLSWNEPTETIQIMLMGPVQIEILTQLIKNRCGVVPTFDSGKILYKETIAQPVIGVGHFEPLRHYAEAHIRIEPAERGSGVDASLDCSEDILAKNWQRLVLTHLEEKQHLGVLTGAPLTDVKITLLTGKAHLKHTEGGDFRQATYRAVRQGLMLAKSQLLEPWYAFRLEVPVENIGRAMSDIQRMEGSFDPPESGAETATLTGFAPVSTMRSYPMEVVSYTRGRGHLSLTLDGYRPCHNAQEVIAESGYQPEHDLDNPADSVFCAHGAGFVVPWSEVRSHMHVESGWGKAKPARPETQAVPQRRAMAYRATLEEDAELLKIFERTYGPIKRDPLAAFRPVQKTERPDFAAEQWEIAPEYLLVDGYNIIFAWDELNALAKESLDAARRKLMDILCNYQGYQKCVLILVFDAYRVPGSPGAIEQYHNIHVVYTKEAETADMFIERVTHEIGKSRRVRVATSDGMEQVIILGHGALRVSARMFHEEVQNVEKQIRALVQGQA